MTILYLGSDPARFQEGCKKDVLHFPVLEIVPRPLKDPRIVHVLDELSSYTHCIFTSKHAVRLFAQAIQDSRWSSQSLNFREVIAIGKSTAKALQKEGIAPTHVAEDEIQEGIIAHLRLLHWEDEHYVLLPRSSLSRSTLETFFASRNIRHQICDLYDTVPRANLSLPPLDRIEEIVFTSPSAVRAFKQLCPTPPQQKKLTAIGPVTAEALRIYTRENRLYG